MCGRKRKWGSPVTRRLSKSSSAWPARGAETAGPARAARHAQPQGQGGAERAWIPRAIGILRAASGEDSYGRGGLFFPACFVGFPPKPPYFTGVFCPARQKFLWTAWAGGRKKQEPPIPA